MLADEVRKFIESPSYHGVKVLRGAVSAVAANMQRLQQSTDDSSQRSIPDAVSPSRPRTRTALP